MTEQDRKRIYGFDQNIQAKETKYKSRQSASIDSEGGNRRFSLKKIRFAGTNESFTSLERLKEAVRTPGRSPDSSLERSPQK